MQSSKNFKTGCRRQNLRNGDVSYTDSLKLGSVATYSCESDDFMLSHVGSRSTCTIDGWDGNVPNCTCKYYIIFWFASI